MKPEDSDRVNWTPRLFLKIFVWFLIIVIGGFFLLWGFLEAEPYVIKYLHSKRDERVLKQIMQSEAELEAAYRADTYGGKTPEETLDLEIKALKENNLELAYKYYEVLEQEKAKKGLGSELKEFGNFDHSIIYFVDVREKGVKGCNKEGDGCTINYKYNEDKETVVSIGDSGDKLVIPKGGERTKFADFAINRYTKVWKLIQP